jgi:hypothetical protein
MLVHFRPGWGQLEFVSDYRHAELVIPRSTLRAALARSRSLKGVRAWLAWAYPQVPGLDPITWTRVRRGSKESHPETRHRPSSRIQMI